MRRSVLMVPMLVAAGFAAGAPHAAAQEAATRPTVAIADVAVQPGGWTLAPPQLGAVIAQLLLDELVTSAQFHVVDGQWLVPESQAGGRAAGRLVHGAARVDPNRQSPMGYARRLCAGSSAEMSTGSSASPSTTSFSSS
jgi:hypothetical protein